MSLLASIGAVIITLLLTIGPLPFAFAVTMQILHGDSKRRFSLYLLTVAILWVACQMVTATGLAFVGHFTLFPVLLCETLLFGAGWWLLRRSFRVDALFSPLPTALIREQNFIVPLLILGYIALLLLGNLLVQPSTDYDSLYYHLPFAANLYASGGLLPYHVPTAVNWYPFGWEALCALFLLPLSGDLLILVPNLLAWMILGLALYSAARTLGVPPMGAILPVLLLLGQPLLIDQLTSLRVDLVLAALFMAGTTFALDGGIGRAANRTLLVMLVLLLLMAVKMSGLIYGGLLLALLLVRSLFYRAKARPSTPTTAVSLPLVSLLGLTTCATALWYARNWLRYGNPLGAVAIALGPWQLFPGEITQAMIRRSTMLALFDVTRHDHWQFLGRQLWQTCGLPGLLLLLLAVFAIVGFARQNGQLPKRTILLTGLAFCLLWGIYWTTPYSGDDGSFGYQLVEQWVGQSLRFTLPALVMLGLLAAFGTSWLSTQFPRQVDWLPVAVTVATLLSIAQRSTIYLLGVSGFLLGILVYLLVYRSQGTLCQQLQRWLTAMWVGPSRMLTLTGSLIFVAAVLLLPLQSIHGQRQRQVYGALPTMITMLSTPGESIGAIATHQGYLAHGPALQRRVLHLSDAFATADALRIGLVDEQISLIVVGPLRPEWQDDPLVLALSDPAQPYELIWDGFPTHPRLYKVSLP